MTIRQQGSGSSLGAFAEHADVFLSAIIESSDDAIVSKKLDGTITSWNPAAERMFGYTQEEAVGRSILMIIPPERRGEETEVISRIRSGARVEHFETVRVRKDGSFIDISLTVSPIRDASGKIVGASKIARDISDRKAAERAILESQALKDQFLMLVSHELRTPIAIIVGNGHLLLRHGEELQPEDRVQALTDITAEAERLQRIIENLLLLTRVEGGGEIELEYLQLQRLVESAVEKAQRRNPAREIRISAPGHLPPVMGEVTLVTLILENLVGNAEKYSAPDQPIDIEISVNEHGDAELHVLDRGIGFSGTDSAGLFTPFFRTAGAKQRASGMGLGLAVARRAAEEQGGTIGASPRAGGGSDFWFTLRCAPEAQFA